MTDPIEKMEVRPMTGRPRRPLVISTAAAISVAGAAVLVVFMVAPVLYEVNYERQDRAPFERIKIGMPEEQVRELLADHLSPVVAVPGMEDYYIDGYSYREREITGKCLIYFGEYDAICYVYLDKDNRVEDVYIGGS